MDKYEAAELYGRMIEDCDLARAIESENFKTLDDVLAALKVRSASINNQLVAAGMIQHRRHAIDYTSDQAVPVKLN